MKRVIVLLLAACLLLSLAAGCGNSPGGSAGESAPAATPAPATPAPEQTTEASAEPEPEATFSLPLADGVVEMTGWTGWSTFLDNYFTIDQKSVFIELEKRTNVHVDWTTNSTSEMATSSLSILAASGDYFDFYEDIGNYYPSGFSAAYSDGFIIDYCEYKDLMPDMFGQIESNEKWKKGSYNDEGQVLFAPYLLKSDYDHTYVGMLTRGDWLTALNIDAPTTYDAFHDMLAAFKAEYDATMWVSWTGATSGNTLAAGMGTYIFYDPYKSGVKQPFFIQDGQVQCGYYMQDGMKDFYGMLNAWYEEGLIYPDFMTTTTSVENTDDSILLPGTVSIFFSNPASLSSKLANMEAGAEIVALADVGKTGLADTGLNGYGEGAVQIGSGLCVSPQCKYLDIAVKWVDYKYTEDGIILCNYGVENEGYTVDADGNYQFTELVTQNPEGMPMMLALNKYAYFYAATVILTGRTDIGGVESKYYTVWGENTIDRVFPADATLTTEEAGDYALLWADIQTCIGENAVKFITGERGIDEIDDFWATLKDLGIEQVLAYRQAAYDRYLAR